jgi:hypothetical protein
MKDLQAFKTWIEQQRLQAEKEAAVQDELENRKAYNWYLGQMIAYDCCLSKVEVLITA